MALILETTNPIHCAVSKIESRACTHIDHGDYIQVFRVIFLKCIPIESNSSGRPRPRSAQSINSKSETSSVASMRLGSKVVLTTKLDHPLDSLQQRIHTWLRNDLNSEVCVLSAETVDIYGKDDDERNLERALEVCFQPGRLGSLNMYAFTAIRLFYCISPKEEKLSLGKSTLSLSAGTSRQNQTPKLTRQESGNMTKKQRWAKNITQESGTAVQTPKLHHMDTIESLEVYTDKCLLSRRPTSQFEGPIQPQLSKHFDDQRMRPRSNSTSCNCM